ncbi:GPI-anchored micronemal antigen [Plasmodium sp. gorilla clade G2]|uniref:GPI-anchored micronemal antigen n=1 Tax=Plasmodium sp. gorilla clade G2 TaxID=880535 RepID=UPI000D20A18C|nr:GPI-anchored micronemal antigen [Plasmodium sp. gorilla clade G2]SOV13834.1 GPI-anchored micronemal antigen [Plasmodium sp. gorilla clade G2]
MKYNTSLFVALIIGLCQSISALIRNSNTPQAFLIPELNNNENSEFNNNEENCDIQKIAEEMMENLLNEKDMYTNIMVALQNRLSDDYLCSEPKYENICIHEKDKISLSFPCSNPKYEKLIHKFTFKKLCNSKAAFNNTLLKSFIEEDEEQNTFSLMLKQFKTLLTCVDDELKSIYKESIDLLIDLRTSITELTQKLWSGKMVNVLKKREFLIAGILCELRNGNKSPLISKSLEFENLGILKINNEELLNEAYNAFSDYYYFFPYFIQSLLQKGGMIERLIKIHENLTKYRTKDMVNKINAQSKGEVLNNEEILNKLNNYKHYSKHGISSFIQSKEIKIVNQNVSTDNTNKSHQQDNNGKNNNQQVNNNNNNNQQVNNNNNNNNNNNQQVNNNNNNNQQVNNNNNNQQVNNNNNNNQQANNNNQQANNNNQQANNNNQQTNKNDIHAQNNNHTSAEHKNNILFNPLYSINPEKPKDIVRLLKDLIKNLHIVKFENNEPTTKIDEEGIRKLLENTFFDLNDDILIVRLLLKPQTVILTVIQSFMLMTPSPSRDAKAYCKKALINDQLVPTNDTNILSEENELVNNFSTKYVLIYEKMKLQELKEMEESKLKMKYSKNNLSALEVRNPQNNKDKNDPSNKNNNTNNNTNSSNNNNNNSSSTPLIAVVTDLSGEKTEDIINNNVDIATLSVGIQNTFEGPNAKAASFINHISYATLLFFSFILINLLN